LPIFLVPFRQRIGEIGLLVPEILIEFQKYIYWVLTDAFEYKAALKLL
jgi:hypothetical protein